MDTFDGVRKEPWVDVECSSHRRIILSSVCILENAPLGAAVAAWRAGRGHGSSGNVPTCLGHHFGRSAGRTAEQVGNGLQQPTLPT